MISNETLTAISPIVTQLNNSGLRIHPHVASPVAALDNAAYTPLIDNWNEMSGFEEAWLKSLARMPVMGTSDPIESESDGDTIVTVNASLHTYSMAEAVDLVATSSRNALKHARTVAKPLIASVIENMNDFMEVASADTEPYEIIDIPVHSAWKNQTILGVLSKHKAANTRVPRSEIPGLPTPDSEVLHKLLTTGLASFDTLIHGLLDDCGMTITDVFNDIFHSRIDLGVIEAPYYLNRNKMLLRYLVASMLIDNPVDNSQMTGMQWDTLLKRITNALGSACSMLQRIESEDVAAKVLSYGISDDHTKVYLNSVVYDKWLNAGGTPEIIYGAVLRADGNVVLGFDDTIENAKTYTHEWSTYHSSKRILQDNERLGKLKDALYSCVLKELDDFDASFYPKLATKAALITLAKERIAKVSNGQLKDTGKVCMDVVCDIFFYHTPAKYLLVRINDRCEEGMAPDEAATAVIAEYITDWVASGLIINEGL